MTDVSKTLDVRLSRLESRNRILWAVLAALVLGGVLGAAAPPDIQQASAFHLVDGEGRVRAELAVIDGSVGLFVRDESGVQRLRAIHDAESTGVYIDDASGTTRIGVAQFAHGGGGFALHGPQSKGAAVLYLKEQGSLRFFDHDGNVTNQLAARPSGTD